MGNRTKVIACVGLVLVGAAGGACGGTEPAPDDGKRTSAVGIRTFTFTPSPIAVKVGSTIRWTNHDDTSHTVTAGTPQGKTGAFDSGSLVRGKTFSRSFDTTGRFLYFCAIHDSMRGEAQVTD